MYRVLRPVITGLLLVGACAATGCMGPPKDPVDDDSTAFAAIRAAFESTVAEVHARPDESWHHAHFGNMVTNATSSGHYGLCYQWQGCVYYGVRETVADVGWNAVGIVINDAGAAEHHGVLVYDPRRIDVDDLLTSTADDPAYVLDAWRRGKPDVFHVCEWITLPLFVTNEPFLEDLDLYDAYGEAIEEDTPDRASFTSHHPSSS